MRLEGGVWSPGTLQPLEKHWCGSDGQLGGSRNEWAINDTYQQTTVEKTVCVWVWVCDGWAGGPSADCKHLLLTVFQLSSTMKIHRWLTLTQVHVCKKLNLLILQGLCFSRIWNGLFLHIIDEMKCGFFWLPVKLTTIGFYYLSEKFFNLFIIPLFSQ